MYVHTDYMCVRGRVSARTCSSSFANLGGHSSSTLNLTNLCRFSPFTVKAPVMPKWNRG